MNQAEKEQLIKDTTPAVHAIAIELIQALNLEFMEDDIKAVAMTGLVEAVERFDPTRGFKIGTFAAPRIRGAILDMLRKNSDIGRMERDIAQTLYAHHRIHEEDAQLPPPSDKIDAAHRLAGRLKELATSYTVNCAIDGEQHDSDSGDQEAIVEKKSYYRRVKLAMAQLPETQQHILKQYFEDGMSLRRIAQNEQRPTSWVHRHMQQALETLREYF